MDLDHHLGLGEAQDVAVVPQRLGVVAKPLAPEFGVGQAPLLEHHPHGAVEDDDPLLEQLIEALANRKGDSHDP